MARLTDSEKAKLLALVEADAVLAEHGRKSRDQQIADELNRVRDDITVPRGHIGPAELLAILDPGDAVSLGDEAAKAFMLVGALGVDTQAEYYDALIGKLAANPKSAARLQAHKTRPGSRAEKEFGRTLTVDEVGQAMKPMRPGGKAVN